LNKSASVGTFLRKGGEQPQDGNRLCKALVGDLSDLFVIAWLIGARSNALGWGRGQSPKSRILILVGLFNRPPIVEISALLLQ
jgi:hypothetical protein